MLIRVRCADCGMTYKRTVLNTNGCPGCGSKQESSEPYDDYSNDYIALDETEEEKLSYKKYIERENYLHCGNPSILTRLINKVKEKLSVPKYFSNIF